MAISYTTTTVISTASDLAMRSSRLELLVITTTARPKINTSIVMTAGRAISVKYRFFLVHRINSL